MTCHLQTVTVSLLPFQFEFFLFIFLLWLPRPGLPKLSWLTVGTVDILVLFLILEILSFFSPVRMTLAVGLSYYTAFIMLGYVVDTTEQLNWTDYVGVSSLYAHFLESFLSQMGFEFGQKLSLHLLRLAYGFCVSVTQYVASHGLICVYWRGLESLG